MATFLTVQTKKINYIVSTNQCLTINRVKYFGNTNVNTVHSTKYTEMNGCMHRLGLGQKKWTALKQRDCIVAALTTRHFHHQQIILHSFLIANMKAISTTSQQAASFTADKNMLQTSDTNIPKQSSRNYGHLNIFFLLSAQLYLLLHLNYNKIHL